jgi:hypothetical protein
VDKMGSKERYWWENDLNSDDRDYIFKKELGVNKSWSDIGENNPEGIKKRQKWLNKVYKKYKNKLK